MGPYIVYMYKHFTFLYIVVLAETVSSSVSFKDSFVDIIRIHYVIMQTESGILNLSAQMAILLLLSKQKQQYTILEKSFGSRPLSTKPTARSMWSISPLTCRSAS